MFKLSALMFLTGLTIIGVWTMLAIVMLFNKQWVHS